MSKLDSGSPALGPADPRTSWQLLLQAIECLSAAGNLATIAAVVLEAARGISGASGATFVLRDGDFCHYLDEDAIEPLWKGRRFPASTCISGWCMLHGRSAVVPDIFRDERIPLELYRQTFVRSLVMVPVGGAPPLAAIGIYWPQAGEPDGELVALLEALARSTATALASAARQEALVRRVEELAALYQLTDRLYRARTPEDAYDAALDAILSAFGCRRSSILLFDEADVMRFVAWRSLSDGYRAALEGHSPWRPGDRDPRPLLVADVEALEESDAFKSTLRAEGIRALAFIPLTAQGAVIGKFMIYHETPHAFDDQEVELAVTVARQLGFSLERQRAEQQLRRHRDWLELATRSGKIGLWEWDILANRVSWTDSLYDIHGVDRATFDPTVEGFVDRLHPDDRARVADALRRALEKDAPYELELRSIRPDGRIVWQFANASVLREDGVPVRLVGATADVTERKQAEERFRLAVEAAPSGMVLADGDARILLVNAQTERLLGYGRDELVGRELELLVPERFRNADPEHPLACGARPIARPMGSGPELYARCKDGREVPVEIGLSPIESNEGPLVLAAIVDISERKRAEHQRELLLAELNHRVKNTLAVVQGLAHQTFKGSGAPVEVRRTYEGRLAALSAAHDLLTRSHWEQASLDQLAADTLQVASEPRLSVAGPAVPLPPKPALAIAMALHELRTNAVKYGALSTDAGHVVLTWRISAGAAPRLRLSWRERGGPPVAPPTAYGFGSRLIKEALAQELDGEVALEFQSAGLVCTLDAPLPAFPRA